MTEWLVVACKGMTCKGSRLQLVWRSFGWCLADTDARGFNSLSLLYAQ